MNLNVINKAAGKFTSTNKTFYWLKVMIIIVVLAALDPLIWYFNINKSNQDFIEPLLIIKSLNILFSTLGLSIHTNCFVISLYIVLWISGILNLILKPNRVTLILFTLAYWIYVSYLYSHGEIHHPESIIISILIILSLFSNLDNYHPYWQNKIMESNDYGLIKFLIFLVVSLSYSFSGAWKLFYQGGIEWMNGYTLEYYMVSKDEFIKVQWLHGFIYNRITLVALSIITIVLELFFPIILFSRRLLWLFTTGIFFFHVGNTLLRGENYLFIAWPLVLMVYIVLDDFKFRSKIDNKQSIL
jgi:hypothetical protein